MGKASLADDDADDAGGSGSGSGSKYSAALVNDRPLHHNSVEIRDAVTENLNSTSFFGLALEAEDWETFVQEFKYPDDWAQAVEEEEEQRRQEQQRKKEARAKRSNVPVAPAEETLSPQSESTKVQGLRLMMKRKAPLSSTELLNLLNRQQNVGPLLFFTCCRAVFAVF